MSNENNSVSGDQERLREILLRIMTYHHSLPEGRAAELDELRRAGILSAEDIEFMSAHSATYKPHRVSDYHAIDMLHMPTPGGGCVFIGPGGPPLKKRRAYLGELHAVMRNFLRIPRPEHELLLHVELGKQDGLGVSPKMIGFNFRTQRWREQLPSIRAVAAELGLHPYQDEIVQIYHILTYSAPSDAEQIATIVVALLHQGCGLPNESEVVYSAGALDEL